MEPRQLIIHDTSNTLSLSEGVGGRPEILRQENTVKIIAILLSEDCHPVRFRIEKKFLSAVSEQW